MTANTSSSQNIPPQAVLLDMLLGMMKTQAIHEAVRLNLAEHVKDGPTPILRHCAAYCELWPAWAFLRRSNLTSTGNRLSRISYAPIQQGLCTM
jgi:hypothetical protein